MTASMPGMLGPGTQWLARMPLWVATASRSPVWWELEFPHSGGNCLWLSLSSPLAPKPQGPAIQLLPQHRHLASVNAISLHMLGFSGLQKTLSFKSQMGRDQLSQSAQDWGVSRDMVLLTLKLGKSGQTKTSW